MGFNEDRVVPQQSLPMRSLSIKSLACKNIPTDLTYLIILRVHFRVQRFKKYSSDALWQLLHDAGLEFKVDNCCKVSPLAIFLTRLSL